MSNNRRYVRSPLWANVLFPPQDMPLADNPDLPPAEEERRPSWWLYCADKEDLQGAKWRPEKDPPTPVSNPWVWRCVACQKILTPRFYICAACEAERKCKGRELVEGNPRCQPGGDLEDIYAAKCEARRERDQARANARLEVSVDPDLLLHPNKHDPDDREEGWDTPSELATTFEPEHDNDNITLDDVAEIRNVRGGYYGASGRLAAERSWYTAKRRPRDVWRHTRIEWAVEYTLWEPYPDEELNKLYRKAYKGGLHRQRPPKRAAEEADGAEERLLEWRKRLDRLLLLARLPPLEEQSVRLYGASMKQVDIADRLGVTQPRVSEALARAQAKLRVLAGNRPRGFPAFHVVTYPKEPNPPTGGHVVRDKPYNTDALLSYWQDNPDKASWRETPKHLR